jgi:hypothetical protein
MKDWKVVTTKCKQVMVFGSSELFIATNSITVM